MFLDDDIKVIGGVIVIIWIAIQVMAKRRPDIAWLQQLRLPEVSPERQARHRRQSGILTGLQFILLGIVLPIGYGAITVMMFNDFETLPTVLVMLASVALIVLGIAAIVTSR
jgi:hypothetical protein